MEQLVSRLMTRLLFLAVLCHLQKASTSRRLVDCWWVLTFCSFFYQPGQDRRGLGFVKLVRIGQEVQNHLWARYVVSSGYCVGDW